MSLLLVMLWAVSCASIELLMAVFAADGHEAGLEERERHRMMSRWCGSDASADRDRLGGLVAVVGHLHQALALVLFDHAAVLAGERLELCGIEVAAGDDEAVRIGAYQPT